MRPDRQLVAQIREALADAGDAERAAQQQAYMKSAMAFHGVRLPVVRSLTRRLVAKRPRLEHDDWEATIRLLWDEATHREERYAALVLLRHRWSAPHLTPKALPLIEYLVVTGAWWDLVDELAHSLEAILVVDAKRSAPAMEAWADGDDMWLRRVAILGQLTRKADTDVALLERCILPNLLGTRFGDEFFIRKAIGWALRQQARVDPEWVKTFLQTHERRLSPLTRREAAKHL